MASTDPLYNDLLPIESRASMGARPQATQAVTPASTLSVVSGALPPIPSVVPMEQRALRAVEATPSATIGGQNLPGMQLPKPKQTPLEFFMELFGLGPKPGTAEPSPANSALRQPLPPDWLFNFGRSPLDRRGDQFGVPPAEERRQPATILGARG